MQPVLFASLLDVASPYRGFLCDAYGVFWNGSGLYPGTIETFEALKREGRVVVVLSNSTQSGIKEQEKYAKFGLIKGRHYEELLTSGDVARHWIGEAFSTTSTLDLPFKIRKGRYFVFGGEHPKYGAPHRRIFDETPLVESEDLDEADFIYIGIPHLEGDDQTDPNLFIPLVEPIVKSGLVMICANPDRFAQEGSPQRRVVRQGSIAAIYEEMGGRVYYIGKPYPLVYERGLSLLYAHGIALGDVLMIGDNVATDICGANRMGISSALITATGLAGDEIASRGVAAFHAALPPLLQPTHWIERLGLEKSSVSS